MAELETGAVVAGHYVIVSLLGQGGMGAVYRARDRRDDTMVAIKVLREARGDLAARFLREARIASALAHPNIARVIEVLELDDGTPAIAMELLTGESLGARLARAGRLDAAEVARVFGAVVKAVKAAHDRGVVHRDLKPDNIFLCEDGTVKVLDFGIARVSDAVADPAITAEALTDTGQILGTPQYMAPEQIFGEKDIDARADIWALGVVLYQAISGVRPFDGANAGQIFKAIALDPPTPLAERAPDAPREIVAIVERMMVHARSERLADLTEVSRVLEGSTSQAAKPARRPRPLIFVALGFTAIGAVAMVATRETKPAETTPPKPPIAVVAEPSAPAGPIEAPAPSTPASVVTVTVASITPARFAPAPPPSPRGSSTSSASTTTTPVAPADAGARTNRSGPLKRDEF